jgi:hypothetical protein
MVATQQPASLKILGPVTLFLGIAILVGSIVDPKRIFTRWYEANQDYRLGWWAISSSPESFRFWIAFTGLFFVGGGIATMVVVY